MDYILTWILIIGFLFVAFGKVLGTLFMFVIELLKGLYK
jgi:hypothetical protein